MVTTGRRVDFPLVHHLEDRLMVDEVVIVPERGSPDKAAGFVHIFDILVSPRRTGKLVREQPISRTRRPTLTLRLRHRPQPVLERPMLTMTSKTHEKWKEGRRNRRISGPDGGNQIKKQDSTANASTGLSGIRETANTQIRPAAGSFESHSFA